MKSTEAVRIAEHCGSILDLSDSSLPAEYYYQSLPLCVIDSIFSIGVNYKSVQNVILKYCKRFSLNQFRSDRTALPPKTDQESTQEFCKKLEAYTPESLADIFDNVQRTSTRGGILKAEAVFLFAKTLNTHGVQYFQDVTSVMTNSTLHDELEGIPGQKSGISTRYFFMLAGSDDLIKPDRMILRFLAQSIA